MTDEYHVKFKYIDSSMQVMFSQSANCFPFRITLDLSQKILVSFELSFSFERDGNWLKIIFIVSVPIKFTATVWLAVHSQKFIVGVTKCISTRVMKLSHPIGKVSLLQVSKNDYLIGRKLFAVNNKTTRKTCMDVF